MPKSNVLEWPGQEPEAAARHFAAKLAFATDPADVHDDLAAGETGFVIVDARTAEAYAAGHLPGAVNLPHRHMDAASTAFLPKDKLMVVYCDGIGCNASTKGALRLSQLGFRAKELLGGLDWWRRDGYEVVQGAENGAAQTAGVRCGC